MDDVSCHKEKLVTGSVYEDEQVMEFMDMDPISKAQVLLVSKKAVSVLKRKFSKS